MFSRADASDAFIQEALLFLACVGSVDGQTSSSRPDPDLASLRVPGRPSCHVLYPTPFQSTRTDANRFLTAVVASTIKFSMASW